MIDDPRYDTLNQVTIEQAEYAKGCLDEFILNKGPSSDDNHDAIVGALSCSRELMDMAFDRDIEGFTRWINIAMDEHSCDAFCPTLFHIVDQPEEA